jgi:hypothetical protein
MAILEVGDGMVAAELDETFVEGVSEQVVVMDGGDQGAVEVGVDL